jgi:hypothetical protein
MIKRHFTIAMLVLAGIGLRSTVANATTVDLINGDSGTINGAVYQFMTQQPTGTGVIQPFLRVQANGTEQGYNTSGGTPFDDKAGIWTHDLQYSALQTSTVTMGGTQYFQLLLDVNEPNGSKSTISLDSLQIYTSSQGSLTTTNISSLGTLRYNLDAGGDNSVSMDAARNHGSGSGDIYVYIPTSLFAGTNATDFIYLYSAFGNADMMPTGGGFEEWALVTHATPIPEVGALFPILGLMAAIFSTEVLRRRRLFRKSA